MVYAAQVDVIARGVTAEELKQLTDDTNQGKIDATVVTAALTEASATVDSYCRQRYAIPLQTSEKIKGVTVDIAIHILFSRRRRVVEDVQQRYDNAIAFLKDVSMGRAGLDQPTNASPQTGGTGVLATSDDGRFSDDNLGGFV